VQYITGKTTTEVITDRVLLEAKRLLLYTDLTMNQISLNVGYSDAAYFSRLFKKHVKINPTDFRKQYKNEHSH
jgi:AraC-like DNA-binding protein